MKSYNNLFDSIVDMDNIRLAHKKSSKGKAHYPEVKWVNANLEEALGKIQESLLSGTYRTSEYIISTELKGDKIRTLHKLPYYPDRIVHHAIVNICGPLWDKTFIRDTFQSIPGRGTTDCQRRVRRAVQGDKPRFGMKIDIKKFYPSVDPNHLLGSKMLKIRCSRTLDLIHEIVLSLDCIPLGNHPSQYLGNLLISPLDWRMKQTRSCKHYFRYCDDIVVLNDSMEVLLNHYEYIKSELSLLGLTIKPPELVDLKYEYLDFVGIKVSHDKVRLREKIAHNFKRSCRGGKSKSVPAFRGWCKQSASPNLFNKHVGENRWKLDRAVK